MYWRQVFVVLSATLKAIYFFACVLRCKEAYYILPLDLVGFYFPVLYGQAFRDVVICKEACYGSLLSHLSH